MDRNNNTSYGALTGKKGELYESKTAYDILTESDEKRAETYKKNKWGVKLLALGIFACIAVLVIAILIKKY